MKINGKLEGFFRGRKDIKQGDPLSHYLFVICMEIFSKLQNIAFLDGKVNFIFTVIDWLTHLCFADVIIIFSKASSHSLRGISKVLSDFYIMSGLQVSYQKCELFCCNVPTDDQTVLVTLLDMKLERLRVRYLWVPLISGKLRDANCQPLIDKFTAKIKFWTTKFSSFTCRFQLIDFVLNHMINY